MDHYYPSFFSSVTFIAVFFLVGKGGTEKNIENNAWSYQSKNEEEQKSSTIKNVITP